MYVNWEPNPLFNMNDIIIIINFWADAVDLFLSLYNYFK